MSHDDASHDAALLFLFDNVVLTCTVRVFRYKGAWSSARVVAHMKGIGSIGLISRIAPQALSVVF